MGIPVEVVENTAEHRFEAREPGTGRVMGFSQYQDVEGYVVFLHTETTPADEGKGVASALVAGAVDQLRASGRRGVALCPYVRAWLKRHVDAADVIGLAMPSAR
ncbi:GNAT family N-acetyltransferase [Cellulomonas massiliensis]|uniref:GNAT family N-acetyltransferase n=1 Tax=Cellulomonas massiliensis TaxID=1465811 RepID=UPI0002EE5FAF|nr:GNAT family N-acetyltransferase [Cellulomonas massiliensis]